MPFDPCPLFEDFLTALGDPEGGDAFYGLHAADAIVRHAEGLRAAADTNRDEFVRAHREISSSGRDTLPRFERPVSLMTLPSAGSSDSVAWFEVTETRDQRKLIAALGIRSVDGTARVGWATLATRIENWTYRDGLLQSLADYAWMTTAQPARARTLLDASYFRLYWRRDVKFSTLPGARFSCQMSAVCCKHDFEITLVPEAQLIIDAMPWGSIDPTLSGTKLPQRPDGKLQLKELNETCRFLGVRGQCMIHQTLGRQPFGPCCIFPVAFAQTPDGVSVALSPICDSTRHDVGIALADREADLRERLAHSEPRKTEHFRLSNDTRIEWDQFREIEASLCKVLDAKELPMRKRLHVGSRLLGAIRDNEPIEVDRWTAEPAVEITPELRQVLRDMLSRVLSWDRAVLRALPRIIPPALSQMEVDEPLGLARILQNTLWSKTYSYPFDLTTAYNFLIVLYLLTLIMQEAAAGPLSNLMWRELGSLGVHGLLKSALHERAPEGFRTVFGTAEFGLWMLAV